MGEVAILGGNILEASNEIEEEVCGVCGAGRDGALLMELQYQVLSLSNFLVQ